NDTSTCAIKMIPLLQLMVSPFSRLRLRCSIMLATSVHSSTRRASPSPSKALSELAGIASRAIALMGERPSRDRDDLLYRYWGRRMSASPDSLVHFSGESALSE